jgi:hypothetical protein
VSFLYSKAEYLRPWKLTALIFGIVVLIVGSFVAPAPDWDVPITIIMAALAYVLAPPTMHVLLARQWRLIPVAALATWLAVDGVYALYWYLRDPEVLGLMRSANAQASLPLYGLSGMLCVYRGSLRELATDLRSALRRKDPGQPRS